MIRSHNLVIFIDSAGPNQRGQEWGKNQFPLPILVYASKTNSKIEFSAFLFWESKQLSPSAFHFLCPPPPPPFRPFPSSFLCKHHPHGPLLLMFGQLSQVGGRHQAADGQHSMVDSRRSTAGSRLVLLLPPLAMAQAREIWDRCTISTDYQYTERNSWLFSGIYYNTAKNILSLIHEFRMTSTLI